MKKIILIAGFLLASTAYAAPSIDRVDGSPCGTDQVMQNGSCVTPKTTGFTALAPIPGLTDQSVTSVANSNSLANFFNNLYKYLIGLAAILAVIEIIWGGLEISTKDSVSKQSDGKNRIQQAIWGLVLILSPVIVFSIINPSILNLSLNLPPLDTKASIPVSVASSTPLKNTEPPTQEQVNQLQKQMADCRGSGGIVLADTSVFTGNGQGCGPMSERIRQQKGYKFCDVLTGQNSVCLHN